MTDVVVNKESAGGSQENVPEEQPGRPWRPKGGEFVVMSLTADDVDEDAVIDLTPKEQEIGQVDRQLAHAVGDDITRWFLEPSPSGSTRTVVGTLSEPLQMTEFLTVLKESYSRHTEPGGS